ncbi:TIGR03915 family putative DNA repair protein [Patiriisocius hiemis]|uniref:TIGR03915 family putative DNA repair protein n=1 Tax=Patiriisocius hiemis TaxID=3075604 RepID=A0ABU2YDN0_9FLAO|nr:TIGR03915 family putative DNA repair protein [Constantimarinum sp. W242]MDT0555900.1 TIGR03915 family putative DNA repair protein [Constantimarinum sp. W242]
MSFILKYDGSFEGFLSTIFYAYEQKLSHFSIKKDSLATTTFFDETITIPTETEKAKRVWKGISKKCSVNGRKNIYRAFLSEFPDIEDKLSYYIQLELSSKQHWNSNYADPIILKIAQVVKVVRREKHRMDAFVRFKQTKDGVYFATIEPDFNVLPLNVSHFKNRFADQEWIIYDLKRKYGVHYNLKEVNFIEIALEKDSLKESKQSLYFSEKEQAFQELWKNYFKSTNIESRKNMKLHIKHVPKRYWKYLSEKQPF